MGQGLIASEFYQRTLSALPRMAAPLFWGLIEDHSSTDRGTTAQAENLTPNFDVDRLVKQSGSPQDGHLANRLADQKRGTMHVEQ